MEKLQIIEKSDDVFEMLGISAERASEIMQKVFDVMEDSLLPHPYQAMEVLADFLKHPNEVWLASMTFYRHLENIYKHAKQLAEKK